MWLPPPGAGWLGRYAGRKMRFVSCAGDVSIKVSRIADTVLMREACVAVSALPTNQIAGTIPTLSVANGAS